MRLVNPKASTFLAILEIFCSGVCVRELLAYGTQGWSPDFIHLSTPLLPTSRPT